MLVEKLHALIKDYGSKRTYWLAYSGGLDSQVLLSLCLRLKADFPFSFRAIHIHHNLSPRADYWAEHCARACAAAQVEFICRRIDARPPEGESLEGYARKRRYEVLAEVLEPQDILLTAHHQDDQAETVLLQLLRGAGPKGLSAMPRVKPLGLGWHARPLLDMTRAELKAYAEAEALVWIEDELNRDSHYARNYLRHELLPAIRKRWPEASKTLARSAENCAEAQALLATYAQQDLAFVAGSKPNTVSVKRLLAFSPARQRLILRSWFEARGVLLPSAVKLRQIQETVLQASWDSQPCLAWGGMELRRYQDNLYLLQPLSVHDAGRVYDWDLSEPLLIEGVGKLQMKAGIGYGWRRDIQKVEVRFRQGGEVYRLPNGKHHELKKFFQEQGLPPWERDRLPLLYAEGELVYIPEYLLVDQFKAAADEPGISVVLNKVP